MVGLERAVGGVASSDCHFRDVSVQEEGAVCGLELQASAEASELLRQSSIATFVKLFNLDSATSTTHVKIPASGEQDGSGTPQRWRR